MFALSLVMDSERENKRVITPTAGGPIFTGVIPGCRFIIGDSLHELRKHEPQSVHQIVASPPYWPAKRSWNCTIGFEETLEEYLQNLVAIFHEARRVLRDDGTLWVIIGDSYTKSGGTWHGDPKQPAIAGVKPPDSTYLLPAGNLLFIPERLAMALQHDGWICRSRVIWQKTAYHPESVTNRPTTDYEMVLILAKQSRHYYYDADVIRTPQKYREPAKLKRSWNERPSEEGTSSNTSAHDQGRTRERFWPNPLGRNAGCVWLIRPSSEYHGSHSATMSIELAERCILVGCPENGIVLDCFGGAGTTALAARKLGRRAISIEIDPKYAQEARHRVAKELGIGGIAEAAD
jgi:DNA modification methylase